MSSGAVADSGLIARVSFTCDTGFFSYNTYAGFSLTRSTAYNYVLDDKINTLSGGWRLKNGLTVDIVDDGTGTGSSTSTPIATGIYDSFFASGFGPTSNQIHIDLLYKGQGEPPSGDSEQDIKDNYWNRVKLVNHTATNGVPVAELLPSDFGFFVTALGQYGDAVAQGTNGASSTDSYRMTFNIPAVVGANNSATDRLRWALNDEVTVEFWDY